MLAAACRLTAGFRPAAMSVKNCRFEFNIALLSLATTLDAMPHFAGAEDAYDQGTHDKPR